MPLPPDADPAVWQRAFERGVVSHQRGEAVAQLPQQPVVAPVRARDARVELTLRTRDASKDVTVTSVLRWPSGDFLERRTSYGDAKGSLRMEEEQCDARLKLCVPVRLTKWAGETKLDETVLTGVQLLQPLERDAFVLVAPQGFTQARSTLVPSR